MLIRPDRRMYTKALLILATITLAAALSTGLAHLAMTVFDADNLATATTILWAVYGGAIALMWLIAGPITALWIHNLSYRITATNVLINKGILTKIEQSIPLRMITDFRLNRSLYDRLLGIGSIDVQTAGQSVNTTGYEGRLSGLADWSSLHRELKGRLHSAAAAPTDAPRGDAADGDLATLVDEVRHIRALLEADRG